MAEEVLYGMKQLSNFLSGLAELKKNQAEHVVREKMRSLVCGQSL
jgi:hypothetical protein